MICSASKKRRICMIFFCFAVQDRLPIVNDFYQFLQNFGLDIWYDRRNIFFGDHRYQTNIQKGAANPQVRYAIVFYSQRFPQGNICLEEYRILEERYSAGELHIFPVFLRDIPNTVPEAFALCKQLVYKKLVSPEDFYRVALHILAKITSDRIQNMPIRGIQDALLCFRDKQPLLYLLLREYDNIEKDRYAMRVTGLFNIFSVATFNRRTDYMSFKTMNYIYHQVCVIGLQEEKRELQIMENIVFHTLGSIL